MFYIHTINTHKCIKLYKYIHFKPFSYQSHIYIQTKLSIAANTLEKHGSSPHRGIPPKLHLPCRRFHRPSRNRPPLLSAAFDQLQLPKRHHLSSRWQSNFEFLYPMGKINQWKRVGRWCHSWMVGI